MCQILDWIYLRYYINHFNSLLANTNWNNTKSSANEADNSFIDVFQFIITARFKKKKEKSKEKHAKSMDD